MNRRIIASLGMVALLSAACSSSGGSAAPASASAGSAAPASASAASAAPAAGAACAEATGTGTVTASIKDFEFQPAAITAKVGDVVTFTNTGVAPHNATLDAGGCGTKTLQKGEADGLRFTAAGTYPFHCTIHSQMKGTITVGA
ncbi:MAG: plastocyanin/azurin family copper-binding protein [Chloroflexota bacterium]